MFVVYLNKYIILVSPRVTTSASYLYTHKKKKQPKASSSKAKLLFFSVLLAICQRNNHFSGCKGTHK